MLRDVFYFGNKPNAHPREKPAKNLKDARSQATTDQFWIINEFCDYKNFEWDFDFDFLPDEEVWAEEHINVWPSIYQKDSGTWLVSNNDSEYIIYRNDVERLKRKNIKTDNWVLIDRVDESKFDFGWHPDPTDPPFIYRWGNKYYPVELMGAIEYRVPGATQVKYMNTVAELLPENERWEIPDNIDIDSFDFSWRPDPREPALIYEFGTQWRNNGGPRYICQGATQVKYVDGLKAKALPNQSDSNWKVLPGFNIEHFDYTWHPDNTAPAYIYVFGNQWYDSVTMPTVEYHVPGATERKYVTDCWATLGKNIENWIVPENIDTTDFDFSWIPNPYDPPMIYQFGTQWQKTGGPRYVVGNATEVKYMDNIKAVMLPNTDNWELSEIVDKDSFDYSWHPDDNDPAFIYVFGNQWYDAETMPTVRYIVKGATEVKYINDLKAKLLPKSDNWEIPSNIDVSTFDFSWIPNPYDKAYIYQFGTQWQKTGGPRYIVEGATEIKYIDATKAKILPDMTNWSVPDKVDVSNFDFSWHPDSTAPAYIYQFGTQWGDQGGPRYIVEGATEIQYVSSVKARADIDFTKWQIPEGLDVDHFDFSWIPSTEDKPYIYQFGTQWQKTGGPRFVCEGATEVKYVDSQRAIKLSDPSKFIVLKDYVLQSFDYSWHPDESEPPYIYQFGNNQYPAEVMPTIEYVVEGASQVKYVNDNVARLGANKDKWTIPDNIDDSMFDYSWVPHPDDPPYNYVFGTQWQKTGGPEYRVDGATMTKYVDSQKVIRLADKSNPAWHLIQDVEIEDFDYSWHPDASEPPYIYKFGNQHHSVESMPTLEYRVEDADMAKYISDVKVKIKANRNNWLIPDNIDDSMFDYSWVPDPNDPPYVYIAGTQWQKTGGPKFISKGADLNSPIKYLEGKSVKKLPDTSNFKVITDSPIKNFDYSWHPDETDPPYVYHFGNNLYDAEIMPTVEYVVDGAIHTKYINNNKAALAANKSRWIVPEDIDDTGFDYSWVPNPKDPAYIYVAGTQHQKTGGPRYVVDGATEIKYLDSTVRKLPNKSKFKLLEDVVVDSFDYSWHPDDNDPPYIYQFGNNLYDAEVMPTLEYSVAGAIHVKYVNDVKVKLGQNKKRWVVPKNIDDSGFDYSWVPNPKDPPYVYHSRTQHQKSGGPKFVVEGARQVKYIDQHVRRLPDRSNFKVIGDLRIKDFDYSWHPDETDPPYVYQFGNNLYDAEIMPTIEYVVGDALHIKYVNDVKATLGMMKYKWQIPKNIDDSDFDYSWVPNPKDPPYIYVSRTQHQKNGGPRYIVEGATQVKYIDAKVIKLADKSKFETLGNVAIADFDYSWHPDADDPPYIYQFGNNFYDAEIMPTIQYKVEGAEHIKYINDVKAKLAPNKANWIIPDNIDDTGFDYSWVPNPKDPPYVYHSRTQHQKSGGPKFIVDGASQVKYIDQQVRRLPDKTNFSLIADVTISDFDYSWHPDETEPPYIYQFGNNLYSAEVMPTVEYKVGDPLHVKYVNEVRAKLAPMKHKWVVPANVDDTGFDYSWVPNPRDPAYIYISGTQHQKTGGPKFIVEGAKEVKYLEMQVKRLPDKTNFETVGDLIIEDFDYSWHPDETAPPYIYVFGNQHYMPETMPTIRYTVEGGLLEKFIHEPSATLGQDKRGWAIPKNIDVSEFDFSWKPNPYDPPYIYRFGTQWQKTGGPTYSVPGGTEFKYIEGSKARYLPNKNDSRWEIPEGIDVSDFDFSWHSDSTERPYIYEFGTQWQKTGGPRYKVPGATQTKYINELKAKALPKGDNWDIPDGLDLDSFDFSWHPDSTEQPMIYQFGTQWQKTGGPRYIVPGAENSVDVVYIPTTKLKAIRLPNKKNWTVPANIDPTSIDYSWHPDNTEAPYIYHFGTQWNNRGGPTYTVPGATFYKYSNSIRGKLLPDKTNFVSLIPIEEDKFDYTWAPHPDDPPYIYVFGNQWHSAEIEPTVEYRVEGATEYKYVHDIKATVAPDKTNWRFLHKIDEDKFDFSWRPNPMDPPYIYRFGNQWHDAETMPTLEYVVGDAIHHKYVHEIIAPLAQNKDNWHVPGNIDAKQFDFSWVPHPHEAPKIYQFGTQWQRNGGPKYVMKDALDLAYVDIIKATRLGSKDNWTIPENVGDFDYSWHPDEDDPPYIYKFAMENDSNDNLTGPVYTVPGAEYVKIIKDIKGKIKVVEETIVETEVVQTNEVEEFVEAQKYLITVSIDDLVYEHPNEVFWAIRENIDYTNFDFNWRPTVEQGKYRYVHVFGSAEYPQTQTYFVSGPMYRQGFTDVNYVESGKKVDEEYLATLFKPNDMFFVDRGNVEAKDRFERLKQKYPNIQKTRFLNSWVDTINRCINRSNTELCWILNSELDYSGFNFNYYPNQWQTRMVHVFGTQWSHWGTTFLVNRDTFAIDTKHIKIVEHLSNLNFVKDRKATATHNLYDVVLIDHGNNLETAKASLANKIGDKQITVVKYDKDYLTTMRNVVKQLPTKKEHYVWVCSSVCDYVDFDFTYITDPFARDNLHVFPSNNQKFGDTFMMDVNVTREVLNNITDLKDYPKIAYTNTIRSKRLSAPVVKVESDTHVGNLDVEFNFPYMIFCTENIEAKDDEPISLWDDSSKNILITSTGASRIIVPREAKDIVKNELYDYPYIKTSSRLSKSKPLDIVFLSNGELCADENYEHLLQVTKGTGNRVLRVDGIDGRVEAYHAALEASETPWAFTVFAKLKVNNKFDWTWQPDRLQIPKHYIFHSKNPLNGLEYGHQGMIAYNKKLTLNNSGKGLDFTLDDPHETVELLSGIATFNTDPYSTWRTAFREVIKLQSDYSDVAVERLNTWLNVAEGEYAEDCLRGAKDAVEYYDSVMGDIEALKKSYEWAWLKEFYRKKYK